MTNANDRIAVPSRPVMICSDFVSIELPLGQKVWIQISISTAGHAEGQVTQFYDFDWSINYLSATYVTGELLHSQTVQPCCQAQLRC